MYKTKLLVFILILNIFSINMGITASTNEDSKISPSSDATISLISQTTNPNPGEDINLNFSISDDDGVSNVTIDYTYSYNGSSFSDVMGEIDNFIVQNYTSYNTSTTDGDFATGNYTLLHDDLSSLYTKLISPGKTNHNELRYVNISGFNPDTNQWETIHENGTPKGSTSLGYPYTINNESINYNRIKIIAQNKRVGGPNISPPNPNISFTGSPGYGVIIPASQNATLINYDVRSIDSNGDTTQYSDQIIVNTSPIVEGFNFPTTISGNEDLLVNVTISDLDGINTLQTVTAFYKLSSTSQFQSIQLTESRQISSTKAIYTRLIDNSNLPKGEGTLDIVVNATDSVDGVTVTTKTSTTQTVDFDNLGPTIKSLSPNPDTSVTYISNSSTINTEYNFTVTAEDTNGVISGKIKYSFNGSDIQDTMQNSTILGDNTEQFSYSIPAPNQDDKVTYSFVFTDGHNNIHETKKSTWYFDGSIPNIVDFAAENPYPRVNESTDIYYNISDIAGLLNQTFYYKNGTNGNWTQITPGNIQPSDTMITSIFTPNTTMPISIKDNNITETSIYTNISRELDVANLTFTTDHNTPSQLLIELILPNGTVVEIANASTQTTYELDLLDMGISSYSNHNYTIRVTDQIDDGNNGGDIIELSITTIKYTPALGRNYKITGLSSSTEGHIFYKFALADNHENYGNTTVNSIYFDNSPPSLQNHTIYSGKVDTKGANSLRINVTANDPSGINRIVVEYQNTTDGKWYQFELVNKTGDTYFGYLPIYGSEGTITYKVMVFDNTGFKTSSSLHTFSYKGANKPVVEVLNLDSPVDLNGNSTSVIIQAMITDDTAIKSATLRYGFEQDQINRSVEMTQTNITNIYEANITVNSINGTIYFYLEVEDTDGLVTTTDIYSIDYINASQSILTQTQEGDNNLLTIGLIALGVIGLSGMGYATYAFREQILFKSEEVWNKIKWTINDIWDKIKE